MAIGKREDPLTGFNFNISLLESASPAAEATSIVLNTLADNIEAGFSECSGLDAMLEVEEYKEGGLHGVLKFPTRMSWGKLVLKKGVMRKMTLWEWIAGFAEGKVMRRDGLITLLDAERHPHTAWKFRRGLPVKYAGPTLFAAQSQVAFETIEIEHEGLQLASGTSELASAIQGAAEAIGSLF
jgi:phage tail-like protein